MNGEQERRLIEFITSRLVSSPEHRIAADTPLFRERLLNSMNILDLVAYVERRMGRPLDEREIVMANFESVNAIVGAFLADEC